MNPGERVVLDASALLALWNDEAGAARVQQVLFHSAASTVTLAEVYSFLAARDLDPIAGFSELRFALEEVVPFTEEQAEIAGRLRATTKHLGLSLGDRACIALAITLGCAVYTADRAWSEVDLGCTVRLIR